MIMVLGPHKKKAEAKAEVKAAKAERAAERAGRARGRARGAHGDRADRARRTRSRGVARRTSTRDM